MSTYTIDELKWVDVGPYLRAVGAFDTLYEIHFSAVTRACGLFSNAQRGRLMQMSAHDDAEEAKAAAQADYISRLEQWLTKVGE